MAKCQSGKRDYIQTYIPHIAAALKDLLGLKIKDEEKIKKILPKLLEKHRGKLENVEMDNSEYDEELAKIGKGEKEDE